MSHAVEILRTLHQKGIAFIANVPTVLGGRDLIMGPEDAAAFASDPEAIAAKHFGVSRDVYVEWLAAQGDVQCAGTTQAGRRCRNSISGGTIADPVEWARAVAVRERCAKHGGAPWGVQQATE